MKKIFLFATFLFFVTTFAQVSANSMPISEMCVGGVGYGSSLGYVKKIYGEPVDKTFFTGEGVRVVTWIYSEYFSVAARTGAEDFSPEENLPVVGFSLKNNSLSTPSGLTVGMNYNEVVKMWGRGELFESEAGRSYFYVPADSQIPMVLTFYVDADGTITEIQLGTDF
ncbi:MAG: hypothetical protein IJ685_03755 [Selenomonadaceae bacterium]|nr:hypothetical protein [Selenomonadaceae bacterium]